MDEAQDHPPPDDGDGLLDWAALQPWIDHGPAPGSGPVVGCRELSGGTQNHLFHLTRADGTEMVLRRPPRHPRPTSDETMLREARVLAALTAHAADAEPSRAVPHPTFFAVCDDPTVIGTCFHLGALVDGFNPGSGLQGRYADDPGWQHALGLSMVDAIASLAAVDPTEVGLADLGRPDGWLERQAPRWRALLESYAGTEGYDGPDLPEVERVGAWLEANRPTEATIGIIHGDFHLANVMARHDRPEVAAVVDWELTTSGDPRLDLAWLLATSRGVGSFPSAAPGFPDWRDLVDRYADRTGLPMDDLAWWWTLACYKLGIILEGTNARAAAGRAAAETGRDLHDRAVRLLTMAGHLVDGTVL